MRRARLRIWVVLGVVVAATAYLMVTGLQQSTSYYMTVDELVRARTRYTGRSVRVMGKIVGETVEAKNLGTRLEFEVAGDSGARLPVVYEGIKPDNMNDGWEAIVEGRLSPEGRVVASKVMIKCPSRYEGEPAPPGYRPSGRTAEAAGKGAS